MEVQFSEDETAAITAEAKRLGMSESEVVRRCVRPLVSAAEPWVSPFEELIGIIKDQGPRTKDQGPRTKDQRDMGRNHDDHLYPRPAR